MVANVFWFSLLFGEDSHFDLGVKIENILKPTTSFIEIGTSRQFLAAKKFITDHISRQLRPLLCPAYFQKQIAKKIQIQVSHEKTILLSIILVG